MGTPFFFFWLADPLAPLAVKVRSPSHWHQEIPHNTIKENKKILLQPLLMAFGEEAKANVCVQSSFFLIYFFIQQVLISYLFYTY